MSKKNIESEESESEIDIESEEESDIEEEESELVRGIEEISQSEEEGEEWQKAVGTVAKKIGVDRFSDIFKPKRKKKTPRKKKRKGISESERKAEEEEERETEKLEKREKIYKATENVPRERFTLWRNLKEFLDQSEIAGKQFDEWTNDLITPTEKNCMIKQTTECTDVQRLEILYNIIENSLDPRDDNVKLYEVLELVHDKTAKFHSEIGSRFGAMKKKKLGEGRDKKLEEIRYLSQKYIETITNIVKWTLDDENLNVLFPYEDMPAEVRNTIERIVSRDEIESLSRAIRKKAIKNQIFSIINLDIDDIILGAENLASIAKTSYLQKQGIKSKKNWGHNRYNIEGHQLYRLMYRNVRLRDDLEILKRMGCTNLETTQLYLEKQQIFANIFFNYYSEYNYEISVLIASKMIPSPFSQSTYLINAKSIELCNMLMWPDRFANNLNPQSLQLFERDGEGNIKLRSQIINDYLDPWYWHYYRGNNFTVSLEDKNIQMSKIALYFLLAQEGITQNYEPTENEFDDMDLFNGSTRIINEEHELSIDRRERDPQRIYLIQYMNRLARGINNVYNAEEERYYVMGDYIYAGDQKGIKNQVIDILSTEEPINLIISPSEYTIYFESLEEKEPTSGSYLTFRVDIHPKVFESINNGYAGHAYKMEMISVRKTPHIWFKDTLALRKNQGSPVKVKGNVKEKFSGWIVKTIQIDAICENSKTYDWKTFPEWMIMMFKLFASIIYQDESFNYQEYMIMIPLDRLKRSGNIPENILVYFLRYYLQFGLCVNEAIVSTEEGGDELYINYDYDYLLHSVKKIYSLAITDDEGNVDLKDYLEVYDVTEPILMRPIPTLEELWKMWQFYTQDINTISFKIETIPDLDKFLINDDRLKSSRMRYIQLAGSNFTQKYYTKNTLRNLREDGSYFDPLDDDNEPLDWATVV